MSPALAPHRHLGVTRRPRLPQLPRLPRLPPLCFQLSGSDSFYRRRLVLWWECMYPFMRTDPRRGGGRGAEASWRGAAWQPVVVLDMLGLCYEVSCWYSQSCADVSSLPRPWGGNHKPGFVMYAVILFSEVVSQAKTELIVCTILFIHI